VARRWAISSGQLYTWRKQLSWRICGIGRTQQSFGSFLRFWCHHTLERRLGWIATKAPSMMIGSA